MGSDPIAVVSGPEWDQDPKWSLDGSRFAFLRKEHRAEAVSTVFVALADGSHVTGIPLEPSVIDSFEFSPDGGKILIRPRYGPCGHSHRSDRCQPGPPARRRATGGEASWRPPLGDEMLFTDFPSAWTGYRGIYAMRTDGGPIRTILPPADGRYRGLAAWSPDGTRIAYSEWSAADEMDDRTHIINADGTGDRVLALPSGAVWDSAAAWSTGTTIAHDPWLRWEQQQQSSRGSSGRRERDRRRDRLSGCHQPGVLLSLGVGA